jgi:protein BCP1
MFNYTLLIEQSHPALQTLKEYLLSKISVDTAFHKTVSENISSVGLIIGERVYNMPPQVMPPLYRILHDEIGWAIEEVRTPFVAS